MATLNKKVTRAKRHFRARKKISGTVARPRLSIQKSNKHIVAQIINDVEDKTLCAVSSYSPDLKDKINGGTVAGAEVIGKTIAEVAKENNIEKVVFDCGGNKYHGRIQAVADAARKAGLDF